MVYKLYLNKAKKKQQKTTQNQTKSHSEGLRIDELLLQELGERWVQRHLLGDGENWLGVQWGGSGMSCPQLRRPWWNLVPEPRAPRLQPSCPRQHGSCSTDR